MDSSVPGSSPWSGDHGDDHAARQAQCQKRAREQMDQRRLEADVSVAAKVNSEQIQEERLDQEVSAERRRAQRRAQAQQKLQEALNIDITNMKKHAKSGRLRNLSQIVFFLVLIGCELDFIGFTMAFPGYWEFKGEESTAYIIKGLLIAMPSAFVLALGMYLHFDVDKADKANSEFAAPLPKFTGNSMIHHTGEASGGDGASMKKAQQLGVRESIHLQFYHFLPLFRLYLVVKSTDAHDIEAIFRVNSLSSFSLGVAQMVAIAFTLMEGVDEMTLPVKINIVSLIVNWFITLLYFGTSIAQRMKTAIGVASMNYNITKLLEDDFRQYMVLVQNDARAMIQNPGDETLSEDEGDLETTRFKAKVEYEIRLFKNCRVSLQCFPLKDVLLLRQLIYREAAADFAKIGE